MSSDTLKLPAPARLSSVGVQKHADCVWTADNILTELECQTIMKASEDKLQRSTVLKGDSEEDSPINGGRTSKNAWLLAKDLDIDSYEFEVLHKIERVAEAFTEIPIDNQEGLQVLKYDEGEQYEPHHDFFHDDHKEYDKCMAEGGQRIFTVYFYLNNVEEGGETFFPRLNVKIKPKMGRVVIWQNVMDGEVFHPSLHWGMPPTKGQKWGCTKWCREREFTGDRKADFILRNEVGKMLSEATTKPDAENILDGLLKEAGIDGKQIIKVRKRPKQIDTSNAKVIIV